jgi:hypothetical protein
MMMVVNGGQKARKVADLSLFYNGVNLAQVVTESNASTKRFVFYTIVALFYFTFACVCFNSFIILKICWMLYFVIQFTCLCIFCCCTQYHPFIFVDDHAWIVWSDIVILSCCDTAWYKFIIYISDIVYSFFGFVNQRISEHYETGIFFSQ